MGVKAIRSGDAQRKEREIRKPFYREPQAREPQARFEEVKEKG